MTLIQRFGSTLNLNIHFHMLFLEGAISENPWGGLTFTRIKAPSHSDMEELVHTISQHIAQYLEKVGLVERDMENSFLNLPVDDEDSLLPLKGASVSYRIAMGPQQGQKVFMLQTLPASNDGEYGHFANPSGFSLYSVPQLSSLTYLDDNSFHIFFKTSNRKTYKQTQIQLSLCLAYSVTVSLLAQNSSTSSVNSPSKTSLGSKFESANKSLN